MKCRTCPRMLTEAEQAKNLKACEVCRGVRSDSKPKAIVVSPPKKAKVAATPGESWWTRRSRAELNAEVAKRFPG